MIDAVELCLQADLEVTLDIIGDGRHRNELEGYVMSKGLTASVRFSGQITAGKSVRDKLDDADLFVMASRQEGLPRAMVEAMARGLPVIGTEVGGIPELIHSDDVVEPDSAVALAKALQAVLKDPDRLSVMSRRNLDKSKEYREQILRDRRMGFYTQLRSLTQKWNASGLRSSPDS